MFKTGERVRVTYRGRTVAAVVQLASPNGRSLFLSFQAVLGGYVASMPVFEEDGEFRDLIERELLRIEPAS